MATPVRRLIVPLLLAASFAHSAFAQAPGRDAGHDQIGAARDLYASARYDEALAVLNDLHPAADATAVSDRKSIGNTNRSACSRQAQNEPAYPNRHGNHHIGRRVEASPRVLARSP